MNTPDHNDCHDEVHTRFMQRCIELAEVAFEHGNTPVGSIVVKDGQIIAEGIEALPSGTDVTGHAELIAVQDAAHHLNCTRLNGTTLYTTAEPCFMCSYAIRNAEVASVIYCLDTPLIGGATSDHPILTTPSLNDWKPAPKIVSGVLASLFTEAKSRWRNASQGLR